MKEAKADKGSLSLTRWAWYPTLLAVAYVLEPYANFDIEPGSGTRVLLVVLAIGLGVTAVWVRLLGRDRGAAAAGITVMALIAATTLDRLLIFGTALTLVAVEWAWARRGTLRLRIPWPRLTEVLNVVLLVLVVLQVTRGAWLRIDEPANTFPAAWAVQVQRSSPDIFVILPDGHGRRDVLAKNYGYDMKVLSESLTTDGLEEATASFANHSWTHLSLAVLFNGRPLDELGQDMTAPENERRRDALKNSSGIHLLKSSGYEVTVIASGFEHIGLRDTDRYVDVGPRNEVEQVFLSGTALGTQLDRLTEGHFPGMRTRTLREIETLMAIAHERSPRPQFVFTHLPAPHWPFVFNADCSLRPTDQYTGGSSVRDDHAGDETSVRAAADQTRCVDRLLADAVHELVAARPDAVVIVLSDHGPDERLDWWAPDEPGLRDRMANLFWARTPGREGLFPDDITLVNVMPILFNAYFGTSLPLHPAGLFFGPAPHDRVFVRYLPPE